MTRHYQNRTLSTCDICGGRIRSDSTKVHRRKCVICKTEFCDPNGKGKVCSEDCRRTLISKAVKKQMRQLERCDLCGRKILTDGDNETHKRQCKVCGNLFCKKPNKWERETCSEECRQKSRLANTFSPCPTCHRPCADGDQHNRLCEVCGDIFCGQGKTCSDECRYKLSGQSHRGHDPYPGSGCGKSGYREDIGVYVRSTWEANYARILNHRGREWVYEPRAFTFSDGSTYRPDFYVKGQGYVEVKGWESPEWEEKLGLFRAEYPGTRITIVNLKLYQKLRQEYRDQIPTWEADGLNPL